MELAHFLTLPVEDVANLVRQAGPQVCVFPINGTRRWFALEHLPDVTGDPLQAYIDILARRHIELYRMIFDHGLETLITPTLGPDILERDSYMERIGLDAYTRIVAGADFLAFYDAYDVRVRVYGDYRARLERTAFRSLIEPFDGVADRTGKHRRFRLFLGAFANDATGIVGRQAIDLHRLTGSYPTREQLVAAYYGEYVDPATIFIGFDKPTVFDYPLLSSGEESLYFTVAPSPYLTERGLRLILYDHLYARNVPEPDWYRMPPAEREALRTHYRTNLEFVMGVGRIDRHGVWIPQHGDNAE